MMTPEQAADYLQLNRETIYRYIRSGRIPAIRLGRRYRIPGDDLAVTLGRGGTDAGDRNANLRVSEERVTYDAVKAPSGASTRADRADPAEISVKRERHAMSDTEREIAADRARFETFIKRTAGILNTGAPPPTPQEFRRMAEEAIAEAALGEHDS